LLAGENGSRGIFFKAFALHLTRGCHNSIIVEAPSTLHLKVFKYCNLFYLMITSVEVAMMSFSTTWAGYKQSGTLGSSCTVSMTTGEIMEEILPF
jgi:hypothetical protein